MMLIPIILLFIDCTLWGVFQQWLLYITLCYLIIVLTDVTTETDWWSRMGAIIAFLLQDFVCHGRFGLALLAILPLVWAIEKLKYTLLNASFVLFTGCLIAFFCIENVIFYRLVEGNPLPISVTIGKIFINLIVGYVILWGSQGNRSLVTIVARGRKVWTPNRMNASRGL